MNKQIAIRQEVATVKVALEKMRPQLEAALPRHLTADRFMRTVLTAVQNNPKLLECSRTSLFAAIITGAQLGLEADGILGQGFLVPFKKIVQFIPGYRGLITLARNSGEVTAIQAQPVYERDFFEYQFGLNERLDHIPARGDRGEITFFYAYAKFRDGGYYWDVMSREQVNAIRENSSGYIAAKRYAKNGVINSPWATHYDEMGRKTAVRRIAKYLPMDVQRAAFIADSYDTGKTAVIDSDGVLQIDNVPVELEKPHADEAEDADATSQENSSTSQENQAASQLDDFAAEEPPHQLGD